MKKQIFYIIDCDGYYLHFVNNCGGYYSHKLNSDGAIRFSSYLVAMTFCMGYNSIAGLAECDKVRPIIS